MVYKEPSSKLQLQRGNSNTKCSVTISYILFTHIILAFPEAIKIDYYISVNIVSISGIEEVTLIVITPHAIVSYNIMNIFLIQD